MKTTNIKITMKRITNCCKHKKKRARTIMIKITMTKRAASNYNEEKGKGRLINMTIIIKRITNNYKHKRKKMKTTKITTRKIMGSYNQKRGGRRPQSKLWPKGSLVVQSTRNKRWGQPRSQLGGLPIATTKKEQAWSAWVSSNSARELYQQHHKHLSSKKRKRVQNFGKHSWKRQCHKRAMKLRFCSLLPSSSSIEKTFF